MLIILAQSYYHSIIIQEKIEIITQLIHRRIHSQIKQLKTVLSILDKLKSLRRITLGIAINAKTM